ncbi:TetR/AcrR family transcriptional regulator [Scytonema millei]|uniref:TetR/AcrR family transcriptional regulator n=1 Tax=Scytonema millei VB511283 TaxID=1245923 RepID=A0A9X5I3P4_9CYAN|nr:TetR/AcrR family transcriptional regulator [Scytonema millei]NHC34006.1 TetR/AcrR family transcriptional regulator [Scytonema millei VB511283]
MAINSQKNARMRRKPQQARSQERVDRILHVAEQMFIESGYQDTTTRAIASRAEIPVGSLYQFFPDKAAILKALAAKYIEQERQIFADLHTEEAIALPLSVYVERVLDTYDRFYSNNPGYRIVFEQLLKAMPEVPLSMYEEMEIPLTAELQKFLARRKPSLDPAQCELIATISVEVVGTLQWLSLHRNEAFRSKVIGETKKLILSYLKLYLDE